MTTHPQLAPLFVSGARGVRRFSATPRVALRVLTNTSAPVLSNRAFVAAWMARRARAVAPKPTLTAG